VPVLTPDPPQIDQPQIDELVDEIRALIEEARRRARRRRLFTTLATAAALAAGAAALFHGGGDGATLGRSEADASPSGVAGAPVVRGSWGASHGPSGGTVLAVAETPRAIYVSTWGGGIFKSVDRGRTWHGVNRGLRPALRVDALALDPVRPATVYAGSAEGVFKSTNAGRSWRPANRGLSAIFRDPPHHRLVEGAISGLTIAPSRPTTIYASTWGSTYRSADAGRSWHRVAALRNAHAVAFAPGNPSVAVATVYRSGTRFLKSSDGGRTWARLDIRLPRFSVGAIAIDARRADTFYVGMGTLGVMKSIDGGRTWRRLVGPGAPVSTLVADTAEEGTVYAGSRTAIHKSTDGGTTWKRMDVPLMPGEAVWLLRTGRGVVYAVSNGRVLETMDGGTTWTAVTRGLHAANVTALAATPGALYAASPSGAAKSANDGAFWAQLETPADVLSVAVAPGPDHTAFIATDSSGVLESDDEGRTWHTANGGLTPHRVFGVAYDRASGRLYAGTGRGIYESSNRGRSWERVTSFWTTSFAIAGDTAYASGQSGGLWKKVKSGPWHLEGRACCSALAIAPDPRNPEVVYVGNVQGVSKSTDGGRTWRRTSLKWIQVQALALDPADPQTIYAGTWPGRGVYRSTDGGTTWKPFDSGLPAGGVSALTFSPDGRRLFAGTSAHGVVALAVPR
jgi:photosystem II stability/assembly factor-like uncharacterized protein